MSNLNYLASPPDNDSAATALIDLRIIYFAPLWALVLQAPREMVVGVQNSSRLTIQPRFNSFLNISCNCPLFMREKAVIQPILR